MSLPILGSDPTFNPKIFIKIPEFFYVIIVLTDEIIGVSEIMFNEPKWVISIKTIYVFISLATDYDGTLRGTLRQTLRETLQRNCAGDLANRLSN